MEWPDLRGGLQKTYIFLFQKLKLAEHSFFGLLGNQAIP